MGIDEFLEEGAKRGYQTYYLCYWYCHGLPIGHCSGSNIDFFSWIRARHNDFKPVCSVRYGDDYSIPFVQYLKAYVTLYHM